MQRWMGDTGRSYTRNSTYNFRNSVLTTRLSLSILDIYIFKGNDKEEYAHPLHREDDPPAERSSEERHAEGSFGTGRQKHRNAEA